MANFRQILNINHSFGIAIIRMCTSLGFQSYYLIHFSLFVIHYFSRVPVKNGVIQALKMAFCIHKQFEHINQILYGLKQWLQANSICKKSRVNKIIPPSAIQHDIAKMYQPQILIQNQRCKCCLPWVDINFVHLMEIIYSKKRCTDSQMNYKCTCLVFSFKYSRIYRAFYVIVYVICHA